YKDAPLFAEARAISKFACDLYTSGEVDQIDILFTNFVSTLSQRPEAVPFLPIGQIKTATAGVHAHVEAEALPASGTREFLFEPSIEGVLSSLLPHYLNFKIYQILLEAKASEQSARMVAMKNATDNAHQIIKGLTLEYNKMRQASITNELLEIATAQMALGG